MIRSPLEKLKSKQVIIRANGLVYRGVLIEATETEILIRRETGFASIPMDRIVSVVGADEVETRVKGAFVDPSFYSCDEPEEPKDS